MNIDHQLLHVSEKLVKMLDETADNCLPKEIANVVKTHSKLAVGSAWIPVPGADVAAGAAVIWGMYVRINNKLGIPFGENIMKSIGSGVATNLASYLAMTGVASAIKFIPGIGSLGGAILMSASLYAVTLAAGWIYLQPYAHWQKRKGMLSTQATSHKPLMIFSDKKASLKTSSTKQRKLIRSNKSG